MEEPGQKTEDFGIDNLPFGVYSHPSSGPTIGIAFKDWVIDLSQLSQRLPVGLESTFFKKDSLNPFIALGKEKTSSVRKKVQQWLKEGNNAENNPACFIQKDKVNMHLPVKIGDYTDFYSSLEHASNVGSLFRDPQHPLLPNWRHLPVAYHGRSSSIVISGSPIRRPSGQILKSGKENPEWDKSRALDFELEVGCIIGKNSKWGHPVPIEMAEEYIFGLVLLNDWSARDIQKWEYVPLGPFLGKNFATSISPWVITWEALQPFKVSGPIQEPIPLPYLQEEKNTHLDLTLTVEIQIGEGIFLITNTNLRLLYWSFCQQIAHHTSNGCNLRIGDILGTGTISGFAKGSQGCLLEATRNGTEPLQLDHHLSRTYLEDYDQVILKGFGVKDGRRVGFGACTGQIVPNT